MTLCPAHSCTLPWLGVVFWIFVFHGVFGEFSVFLFLKFCFSVGFIFPFSLFPFWCFWCCCFLVVYPYSYIHISNKNNLMSQSFLYPTLTSLFGYLGLFALHMLCYSPRMFKWSFVSKKQLEAEGWTTKATLVGRTQKEHVVNIEVLLPRWVRGHRQSWCRWAEYLL